MTNRKNEKTVQKMTSKRFKNVFTILLTAVMLLTLIPIMPTGGMENVEASTTLRNPRKDSNGEVTYDCVWFGSYPQAEVITTAMSKNYTAIDKTYLNPEDLIVDDKTYQELKNAKGWDTNGDIILSDGGKYRRIKKSDATYVHSISGSPFYYNWSDDHTYHYYKYQPIKWRVLHTDGNEALLMADKGIDDQKYNTELRNVTWETCTMRSFLNGYGSASNKQKEDYTKKNFINSAFTSYERNLIKEKTLENKDNLIYGAAGGNSTKDKVFLLSYDDVTNSEYGFLSDYSQYDKARRIQQVSTYAKAMGAWWSSYSDSREEYQKNGLWWLRSPGRTSSDAMYLFYNGYIMQNPSHVHRGDIALVPALYLNLSSSNLYSYAGTVCTDGSIREENTLNKNGLIKENGTYYYYKNNIRQTGYTGMVKNSTDGKWYYVEKGVCKLNRTGLVKDGSNWTYVKNSVRQSNYTGMVKQTNGKWYYVEKGRKKYVTQLVKHTDGSWWYVKNSEWQPKYTGMVKQPSGNYYYVKNGKRKYVTQLVKHTDGSWWYVKNSNWQPKFTGIVKQLSGRRYYVKNGKRKNITGYVTVNGKRYKLVKGEVK